MPESTAIPVAVALIVRDGAVLMGERRPHKVYPFHWEFPGGKLEPGETAEQALRRELNEELGIVIGQAEEWFAEIATYSNGMTYDIRYFVVREFTGELQNHEFNRIAWIGHEALADLLHLTGNKRILDKLNREGIPG